MFDLNEYLDGSESDIDLEYINVGETVGDRGVDINVNVVHENVGDVELGAEVNVTAEQRDLWKKAVDLFDNSTVGDTEILPPVRGMVFQSGDDFVAFVFSYAYKMGFDVLTTSNEILQVYKEQGFTRRNPDPAKVASYYMMKRIRIICRKASDTQHKVLGGCRCPWVVDARISKHSPSMKINVCRLKHNHPINPEDKRFMANYKSISSYFKKRMLKNAAAGISVVKNYNALALDSGGVENMTFSRHDLRNSLNLEKRAGNLMGDAVALEEYFKKLSLDNPDFFYAIDRDEEGRLRNVFWADARCRALFKVFCDVVTFDTTFLCNRYRMPFAPFIGVNHHGTSTLFAAALITREDTDSFIWVFNKWLECMWKAPAVMLTDQCRAIGLAIRTVFGENYPHRLCIWHIMKNAEKNLGRLKDWKDIEVDLKKAFHDSLEVVEFEFAWSEMLVKYDLGENPWLGESYEI